MGLRICLSPKFLGDGHAGPGTTLGELLTEGFLFLNANRDLVHTDLIRGAGVSTAK